MEGRNRMKKYVLRRALIAIPTFFGITVLVFLISSMASGSPLELLLNNQNISAAEVERQRIKLGLDQPLYIQYFTWIKNFFQGNLGDSYRTAGNANDFGRSWSDNSVDLCGSDHCLSDLNPIRSSVSKISE